jgi:2-dehydro-3-deoxyphosphogluconate aldolase/(4S)-4-hydroxy-2-oxoglutarate aldolase
MTDSQAWLAEHACKARILPVVVIDDAADAVPLARTLYAAGLPMIEVTLRTPAALPAIAAIRSALPDMIVGAGTVTGTGEADAARAASAQFAVSPGYSSALGQHCRAQGLALLPGVATATEVMLARADGFDFLKLFPAAACGGIALLEALHGPFPEVRFCPTGGIDATNAAAWLARPNVLCIGGSWVAPRASIRDHDWDGITSLALDARSRIA